MSVIPRYALLAGIYLSSSPAYAEDSFSTVMARMKPQQAQSIHYQETRYLELLDKPWHGSGYLYALPPDRMIKEQWRPKREVMGADGKQLYYYDPSDNVRHHTELRNDDPIAAHVEAFRALLNGNRELIDSLYRVEFYSSPESWQLTLTSKNPDAATKLGKVVISGLPEKPADKVVIFQADGDRSELSLRPEPDGGVALQKKVDMLFKELQGSD